MYVYWIFDQSARLLASAAPTLQGCEGVALANNYVKGGPPRQATELEKACFASFFGIKAFLNRGAGATLLNAYTVELPDLQNAVMPA